MTYTAEDRARIDAAAYRMDCQAVVDGCADDAVYDRLHAVLAGGTRRDAAFAERILTLTEIAYTAGKREA